MHANIFSPVYIIANMISLLILIATIAKPPIARFLLSLIFTGSGVFNGIMAILHPDQFLTYGDMAVFPVYEQFIYKALGGNPTYFILAIAVCQLITGILIASRDSLLKTGLIAATIFLLAIAPLGAGAAFPCTLLLAVACIILLFKTKQLSTHRLLYSLLHLLNLI